MRTKQRLIEVLESLNDEVLGFTAHILRIAARDLKCDDLPDWNITTSVRAAAMSNPSPHVRQLAREAMYWIECRALQTHR